MRKAQNYVTFDILVFFNIYVSVLIVCFHSIEHK